MYGSHQSTHAHEIPTIHHIAPEQLLSKGTLTPQSWKDLQEPHTKNTQNSVGWPQVEDNRVPAQATYNTSFISESLPTLVPFPT